MGESLSTQDLFCGGSIHLVGPPVQCVEIWSDMPSVFWCHQLHLSFSEPVPTVSVLSQCLPEFGDWIQVNQLNWIQTRSSDCGGQTITLGTPNIDGVCLPLSLRVAVFWCSWILCWTWIFKWQWWLGVAFYQIHLIRRLWPFLSESDLGNIIHVFVTSRLLLYYILCRAALENCPEATAGAECSTPPSDGSWSSGAHNSSPPESTLAPSGFWGTIQGASFDL